MGFDDDGWFGGWLRELDEDECWELLEARPVDRVGYVDDHGPAVLPVNFVVVDRTVVVRVSPYSVLGRNLPGAAAAFEADEIDEYTRSAGAWSCAAGSRSRTWTTFPRRSGRTRGPRADAPCSSGWSRPRSAAGGYSPPDLATSDGARPRSWRGAGPWSQDQETCSPDLRRPGGAGWRYACGDAPEA